MCKGPGTCKTIVCPGLPILCARAQSILGIPGPLLGLGTVTAFRAFSLWEMASNAGLLNKGATLLWKYGRHRGSGRLGPMDWREDPGFNRVSDTDSEAEPSFPSQL